MIDIKTLISQPSPRTRYDRQLQRLREKNFFTDNIEKAVTDSVKNISDKYRSFVIYGEPQSGKTEMMIALTAKLLDEGFKVVVVLLNDSVQLLSQNLERFRRSGIDPAPKNYSELLDPSVTIGGSEWIIFCKKNSKDLSKLLQKAGRIENKVIIDDEADFASPNSKINKGEKTRINALIEQLLGEKGVYIGVTATPGRLDLNNTFRNENERWVDFPPHPLYKGQETFFPASLVNQMLDYDLVPLPDEHDNPKYLREAMFRFLIKVAHLNLKVHTGIEKNYCILIHTSGKRADHTSDYQEIVKLFNILKDSSNVKCEKYYSAISTLAEEMYPGEAGDIISYIHENRNRYTIVVMNSDIDKSVVDYKSATDPSTLFTIAIGGNIVSRGVTFERLLSMFFTRDVKHKIQQDTYIQRARMFGSRGEYLCYMELHIPERLYLDWHKCFIFHQLSLAAVRTGNGSPVWLEDKRVRAISTSSIDKTTVAFDSGEMSFEIFDYSDDIENVINSSLDSKSKLAMLAQSLGEQRLPGYLLQYIEHFSPHGTNSLAIHATGTISKYYDANKERIERPRGFIGTGELEQGKYHQAIHHIKIFKNASNKARVFYKYVGDIRFIKNLKKHA